VAILKFKDPITGLWNAVKIYARSLGFSVDGVGADSEGNVALGALRLTGGNMTGAINEALVTSMALSGTMNIGAAAGNYITVTAGAGPITAFDAAPAGSRRFLKFSVSATINYNATTMLIPGSENLSVVSGDVLEWVSGGSGVWRCVNIERWNRIEPSTLQPALSSTNTLPTTSGGLGASYANLAAIATAIANSLALRSLAYLHIQTDYYTMTVPAGQTSANATITYNSAFSSEPIYAGCGLVGTGFPGAYGGKYASLHSTNPTSTQISLAVQIGTAQASDVTIPLRWIAIGYK